MKIQADKEGIEAIKQLCDAALRVGGLSNLQGVTQVLQSTVELKEVKEDKPAEQPKKA